MFSTYNFSSVCTATTDASGTITTTCTDPLKIYAGYSIEIILFLVAFFYIYKIISK